MVSRLGRLIFGLSGFVYARTFIRAAGLNSRDVVLEVGCGMGTILTAAQERVRSRSPY